LTKARIIIDRETLESQKITKLYFIGFPDEMKDLRDEMKAFRHETNQNFAKMDAKYGDISKELKEFRKTVKTFLDAFLSEFRGQVTR